MGCGGSDITMPTCGVKCQAVGVREDGNGGSGGVDEVSQEERQNSGQLQTQVGPF